MFTFVWILSFGRICETKLHDGMFILCFTAFWVEIHNWSSFTLLHICLQSSGFWVLHHEHSSPCPLVDIPTFLLGLGKAFGLKCWLSEMVLATGNASGSMDFLFLTFLPRRDVLPCFSLFQEVGGRTTWRNCPGTHEPGMSLCFEAVFVFTLKAWWGKLSPRHLRIFDATVSGIASKFFIFYVYCWYIKAIFHNEFVCRDLADFTH